MGAPARIAIACCRSSGDGDPGDLYPDPDSDLLVATLTKMGLPAALVSWDDPAVIWERIDLVAVRSTWDSVDRPREYLRWAFAVDRVSTLVNPAKVLAWNLDKAYLEVLARLGVPVVPTRFVRPGSPWALPQSEFVVKPAISAGGRETARYSPAHRAGAEMHVGRLLAQGHTVMIQPYLPAVEDPGEISLVYVEGEFSHAVRKAPVLETGAAPVERPWERMVFLGLAEPTSAELAVAAQVHAALHRQFGRLTYSRVDLVADTTGNPLILEVELIDPNLSLSLQPHAVSRLALALDKRLNGATLSPGR